MPIIIKRPGKPASGLVVASTVTAKPVAPKPSPEPAKDAQRTGETPAMQEHLAKLKKCIHCGHTYMFPCDGATFSFCLNWQYQQERRKPRKKG